MDGRGPDALAEDGDEDSSDEEAEALGVERMAYGTQFVRTSKDKMQPVPSVTWTLMDPTKMPKTCVRESVEGRLGTKYAAELINIPSGMEIDSLRKMWVHLQPKEWLTKLVQTANSTLYNDPEDRNYRKTDVAQMECVLGLMLAASVMGVGSFEECFTVILSDNSICPPAGFGKHGVTKNRALILYRKSHLTYLLIHAESS